MSGLKTPTLTLEKEEMVTKTKTTTAKEKAVKTMKATDTPTATTVTETTSTATTTGRTKKTKQQKVIAFRAKYPDMSNKDIATKVGCNPTYVSQILRGGITKTAAKRRGRAAGAITTDTQSIITAYHDMQCIVKRVGTCSAKTLLEDITNGTT